jgi:hypothetical protein
MEAREEEDAVNDYGRDPIGEGKEEQVSLIRCDAGCSRWADHHFLGLQSRAEDIA